MLLGGGQYIEPTWADIGNAAEDVATVASFTPLGIPIRLAKSVPLVVNAKLVNLVRDLYKGAKMPKPVGTGSTADAIRSELATGLPTGGRFHSQKGAEYVRALEKWLTENPSASHYDRMVAESIKNDLLHALKP